MVYIGYHLQRKEDRADPEAFVGDSLEPAPVRYRLGTEVGRRMNRSGPKRGDQKRIAPSCSSKGS